MSDLRTCRGGLIGVERWSLTSCPPDAMKLMVNGRPSRVSCWSAAHRAEVRGTLERRTIAEAVNRLWRKSLEPDLVHHGVAAANFCLRRQIAQAVPERGRAPQDVVCFVDQIWYTDCQRRKNAYFRGLVTCVWLLFPSSPARPRLWESQRDPQPHGRQVDHPHDRNAR
jgi:hypothetical protein